MRDDVPFNRRSFFRQGLRELLKNVVDAAKPLGHVARQFQELERAAGDDSAAYTSAPESFPHYSESKPAIRPPGALLEGEFLNLCTRCGDCVRVCPAQCIVIDPAGYAGGGAPYIDPEVRACVLCEGILCSNNCPPGALVPTAKEQVKLGTATWHEGMCLRSLGQECTVCIDRCPVGAAAIKLVESRVEVHQACTGCGVCQQECPTVPKSITIFPRLSGM